MDQPKQDLEKPKHQDLEKQAAHNTAAAQMVLPGLITLFSFQIFAALSPIFYERLSEVEQCFGLFALWLVAVGVFLIVSPAAYHRQAEPGVVSDQFVKVTSIITTVAMWPLAVTFAIDAYIVSRIIVGHYWVSIGFAASLLVIVTTLWFVIPHIARRKRALVQLR